MSANRRVIDFHNDYLNGAAGFRGFTAAHSGGSITAVGVTGSMVGIGRYSTGVTASVSQRSALNTNMSQIILASCGEAVFYADVMPRALLDPVTNTGFFSGGFVNAVASIAATGAFFFSENGGNLFARTSNGGVFTGTDTDTGVAFTADVQRKLEIRVSADGLTITYYIDGELVATHTANIPTAAVGVGMSIVRSPAVAYAATFDTSYLGFRIIQSTDRYP
jgi:hypothetical protein